MRAYVIDRLLKDPGEELASCLVDTPDPKPGNDSEVLVEVSAAGLNWFDWLQIQGKYQSQPTLPFVAGAEFAGRIAASSPVPQGCPYEAGTRVLGAAQGAYGEKVVAKWQELIPVPDNLSDEAASGIFITYPTSYAGLRFRANVQAGETVLVTAGAGGVGLAACQIAKALGARVIAAAGTDKKLDVCKRLGGADEGVNYAEDKNWQKTIMKMTGGKGVDVVYDPVGMIIPCLKVVNWGARIIVVGFASGTIEKVPANLLLLKSCSVTGVFWGAMAKKEPEKVMETWGALLDFISEGKLKPVVYEELYQGLEQLPRGLKALANRQTYGKAVVTIRSGRNSRL